MRAACTLCAEICRYRFSFALISTNCLPFVAKTLGTSLAAKWKKRFRWITRDDWPATKHDI
jgi:hypothetical protein